MGSAYEYLWDRAFSWNDVIVAPTRTGVSIIRPDRRPMELHHEFKLDRPADSALSPPQVLLDWKGLVAWIPSEPAKPGSEGAIRFVNDTWTDLDSAHGWPKKLLHLVPLLDGSIIQLVVNDDDTINVALASLDRTEVDEQQIRGLVDQLADEDPDKRAEAFAQLTRYGTGVWPILEKLAPDQPPEAKRRIEELLDSKVQPTLGGMSLVPGGKVSIVARLRSGAAILYADSGVRMPPAEGDETVHLVAPAWLMILPGRPIQLAPGGLVKDFLPGKTRIAIVGEEFIVSDNLQGPRWWLSNHFSTPLLKKSELEFRHLVGFDLRGRWIFRHSETSDSPTLVIDPTLPDPTPRLPVWDYPVPGGTVGWTAADWPAIKRGGAWMLNDQGWVALDESKEKMVTDPDTILPATSPATMPATWQAASQPTTAAAEQPILTDADGTLFFDGRQTLRVRREDGTEIVWPLPPECTGSGDVRLIRAGDNRLFLFNSPGRVVRIKPTPQASEPFKIESTFTRRIPSVDQPIRIWKDPAGRINMIAEPDHLLIMFPTGRIPKQIAEMMPAGELKDAEGE